MPMWDPWRGCKKCSEGCLHCYIHKGDAKRGVDTGNIVQTKDFDKPVAQLKKGGYKMKPGLVYLGFSTDFLIEETDAWRGECWRMIKERSDCTFLFLTKRIERFAQCIPEDWADGYENVTVCCTIENQRNADKKLSVFQTLPIKHKCITAQPLIERVYNGPQEIDHIFQMNREHGKINQRKRKESILCHEGNTHRNLRPRSFWRYSRESGSWEPYTGKRHYYTKELL